MAELVQSASDRARWQAAFAPQNNRSVDKTIQQQYIMAIDVHSSHEARKWLDDNQSSSGFATNRFQQTQNARVFVQGLYDAGAISVRIPYDAIRSDPKEVKEMGGPYADTLIVELPDSGRESVYRIFEAEAESEGYEGLLASESLIGGKYLYFWWD